MKFVIALALIAVVAARPEDHYDTKFDSIDVDEIIQNERFLKNYASCFVGTGKCTSEGQEVKGLIPEGVRTGCAKCTEKQKPKLAKFISAVREKVPEKWALLNEQHNADGKYNDKLEEFLNTYNH